MPKLARLTVVLAAAFVPAATAAIPAQVAFKQFPGDRQAIVRLDETGAGKVELTRGKPTPSEFGAFSWSPDGSRLVYSSDDPAAGGGGDLYSLSADGTHLTRLTSNGGNDDPAWSPDGGRIAFVHRGADFRHEEIWLVRPDGSAAHPLTSDSGEKRTPRWAPDGSRLLYSRLSGSNYTIVVHSTSRPLFDTPGFTGAWSPDGSRIAVESAGRIDIVNADGTGRRTVAARDAEGAAWSPDGSKLAFVRRHCTPGFRGLCEFVSSVFVVGADGTGQHRLTGPIGGGRGSTRGGFPLDGSQWPAWWPDGSRLFFRLEGYSRVMNADGTCEQRFGPKDPNLFLGDPAWRPGPRPSPPQLTCADMRVRVGARRKVARGHQVRIYVTVENDGNQPATGVKLTIRLAQGRARIQPPLPSCRRGAVIECALRPLPAGGARHLLVRVVDAKPRAARVSVRVTAQEADSDRSNNTAVALVAVR